MPRTLPQKLFFSFLMAALMVYGMELYNLILQAGAFSFDLLLAVFADFLPLVAIVVILQWFIGGPLARWLAFHLMDPHNAAAWRITLTVSLCTVCLMCPMMSCVATLLFKHPNSATFVSIWLNTFIYNLPMALLWQLLCAGPLTRFTFRRLFLR